MKTKFLIALLLLAASSAFAQVPSYVPTNGLVGWWPFNGNANDESGNGNNGTVNGATLTTDRFGNTDKAYSFNGTTDDITYQQLFPFHLSNNASLSIWLNGLMPPNGIQGTYLKSRLDQPDNNRFNLFVNPINQDLKLNVDYRESNFNIHILSIDTVPSGNWINIVLTRNNNTYITYINGQLASMSIDNNPTLPNSIGWVLGNDPSSVSDYAGKIDDIGIWNRALTQQEITSLYNAQSCTGTGAITADGPTTFCAGNYVNLTSDVVGGTYQWKKNGVNVTTNGTSRTYKATATGSYTCVATCNGTALTSNAIAVTTKTNAAATVTASGATSFCLLDSVTLNCTNLGSNYSVQWYRTNVSMENATNYSQVVKQPGTYKVVTKNLTTGCSRISGTAITTAVNCRIAGDVTSGAVIQENTNVDSRFIDNELSQGVHIYPNPNSGVFSFNYDGEETGDAVLQVINNMGQSIYQSRLTIPEGGFTQDLQLGDNITKGIYIVRLFINDSYHDSKVMVK